MTALGVWTCRWRELRPISFGGITTVVGDVEQQGLSDLPADGNENGVGFVQGRRAGGLGAGGLGADGGGAYEMVDRSDRV